MYIYLQFFFKNKVGDDQRTFKLSTYHFNHLQNLSIRVNCGIPQFSHNTGVDVWEKISCAEPRRHSGSQRLAKGSFRTDRFLREVDFLWNIFTCYDPSTVHHSPLVARLVTNVTPYRRYLRGRIFFVLQFFVPVTNILLPVISDLRLYKILRRC